MAADGRQKVRAGLPPIATEVTDAIYSFPDRATDGRLPNRLLCAGREHCLPSYHVSRSEYHCVILEFIFSGKGKIRIGKSVHEAYPGVMFSYGMDAPHDLWADAEEPMKKYFAIYVSEPSDLGQRGQNTEKVPLIKPGEIKRTLDIEETQTLFDQMIAEGRRSGSNHSLICDQYLQLILMKASAAGNADSEEATNTVGLGSYERVASYIENHYTEVASLNDLAAAVELSPAYLCRLFRRYSRETPRQSIVRHKLNRAAELLMSQGMNVGEVAAAVGYEDAFHFSRLFRKRFGNSPKNFCTQIVANQQKH